LFHGPGESIMSGDGSGVKSVSAFSMGDERAEPGDNEPVMLARDGWLLKKPSCIAIGAVAECRSFPPVSPSRLTALSGDCASAVVVVCEGRSVWSCRPAAVGWRTWARKGCTGSVEEDVEPSPKGGSCAFTEAAGAAFVCVEALRAVLAGVAASGDAQESTRGAVGGEEDGRCEPSRERALGSSMML
jgi:hypothetical protein